LQTILPWVELNERVHLEKPCSSLSTGTFNNGFQLF